MSNQSPQINRHLFGLAVAFVLVQGLALTLSPAVRERSLDASPRLSHWIGIALWLGATLLLESLLKGRQARADPFLFPVCALLAGWGMLAIWRIDSAFGLRQSAWIAVSAGALVWLIGRWDDLRLLERYRSVLLAVGLLLTALTIVFGTSPTGLGPRLWLGCCGVYLQPSEPLKLILVVYLAAYFARRKPVDMRLWPTLVPTIFVGALALAVLVAQQDLGSASILIMLFTVMVFAATERRRVLLAALLGLGLAIVTGYLAVDVVRTRMESWINPWADPSGQSYQIVQSLLAVANGGILGRGLGLGSPSLVPVAHSDFIYTGIAEETGFAGGLGLLLIFAILLCRGMLVAAQATDRFYRLLAAGLTAYFGIQTVLIVGGDLRMLPLTGVTLPFVSYGGSSLLTASVAAAMLWTISARPSPSPHPLLSRGVILSIVAPLGLGLVGASLLHGWWAVVRGADLLSRTDNARRAIADRYVARGTIFDRNDVAISQSQGNIGDLSRHYWYPELAPIVGYTHPVYGQAGLEASMDAYLRGLQGNPVIEVVWQELLYGTPPPGLDVRLTLDLRLQERADSLLAGNNGAIVLMNATTGEVLAMASHPTYDANNLTEVGASLAHREDTPLLNRAVQGLYQVREALGPVISAVQLEAPERSDGVILESLGLLTQPDVRLPSVLPAARERESSPLRASPLQVAAAVATLSNDGVRPTPRIALAIHSRTEGWLVLPPLGAPVPVLSAGAAERAAREKAGNSPAYWEWQTSLPAHSPPISWYVAGAQPGGQGAPLVVVVLLEEGRHKDAASIGSALISATAPR